MVSLQGLGVGRKLNSKTADQNSLWRVRFFSSVGDTGLGVYQSKEIKVLVNFFGHHINNYFCQGLLKQREESQSEPLLQKQLGGRLSWG